MKPKPRMALFVPSGETPRRNQVLTEVGCLLAAAGRRVLIIADAPNAVEIRRYLRAFPSWESRQPEVGRAAGALLRGRPPSRGEETANPRRYLPPAGVTTLDLATVPAPCAETSGSGAPAAAHGLPAMTLARTLMSTLAYDEVLVACDAAAAALIAGASDLVVLCCAATGEGARSAAAFAGDLLSPRGAASGRAPARVVAVTHCHPETEHDRLDRLLGALSREFREVKAAQGDAWRGFIVVKGLRHPAAQDTVAVYFDDPAEALAPGDPTSSGTVTTPLAGYAALASLASAGAVSRAPAVPASLRSRYRRRVVQRTSPTGERVLVAYATRDRPWAEWIVHELRRSGLDAHRFTTLDDQALTSPKTTVVVLGAIDRCHDAARAWLTSATGGERTAEGAALVCVRLPSAAAVRVPLDAQPLDLSMAAARSSDPMALGDAAVSGVSGVTADPHAEEVRIRTQLLAAFLLPARTRDPSLETVRWSPRCPASAQGERASNVLPPTRRFVGRDQELEALRDGLLSGKPCLVSGPPAVGKSELVRKYAEWFNHDYDLVWWVPAGDATGAKASWRALQRRVPSLFGAWGGGGGERFGTSRPRCLIILDNADDLTALRDIRLPGESWAHVAITTRAGGEAALATLASVGVDHAWELPVTELSQADGVALLTRRLPALTPARAAALTGGLGLTPLALRLAEAGISERIAALQDDGMTGPELTTSAIKEYLRAGGDAGRGARGEIGEALEVTLGAMERVGLRGRLARLLACVCAFLSPDGVSLALLRSTPMLERLASLMDDPADGAAFLRDIASFDTVVWLGERFGIFDVDWDRTRTLRAHRVVRELLLDALPTARRDRVRAAVLAGLASCAPSDVQLEISSFRELQGELHRHLVPSGALEASDWQTRQWVVKQMLYVARYGDNDAKHAALEVANALDRRWSTDPRSTEDLLLRLGEARGLMYQKLLRPEEAVTTQLRVLEGARRVFGAGHVRTLLAADLAAWYLRESGRFSEAMVQDTIAYSGLRRHLGADHPDTLRTANNLTFSLFVAGETRRAERLAREVFDLRYANSGWDGELTAQAAAVLATYLTELGEYQTARSLLDQALDAIRRKSGSPDDIDDEITVRRCVAAVWRGQGRYQRGLENDLAVRGTCFDRYGPSDPKTLACEFALAADQHGLGLTEAAVERATRAAMGYRAFQARHPYRFICLTNLAVFQRSSGRITAARDNADQALDGLRRRVGEHHPWSLAAEVNWVTALAVTETGPRITRVMEDLARACQEFLEHWHPTTRIAMANHKAMVASSGGADRMRLRPITINLPVDP